MPSQQFTYPYAVKRIASLSCLFLTLFLLPAQAFSQTILIKPFETIKVDQEYEKIFRQVLSAELAEDYQLVSDSGGEDTEKVLADKLVSGSLSRLGEKIIVVMQVEDHKTSEVIFSERVNAIGVQELDIVAGRLAKALRNNMSFRESASINNIVTEETRSKKLKQSMGGMTFEIGSFNPTGGENYGEGESGIALTFGTIAENENFFYQPSIGFRSARDHSYREIPLDISIGRVFSDSGAAPFISGGLGLRYIEEKLKVNSVSNGGLVRTVNQTFEEDELGFGAHLKMGIIFMREHASRVSMSVRYDVSDTDPFDRDLYESVTVQMGILSF